MPVAPSFSGTFFSPASERLSPSLMGRDTEISGGGSLIVIVKETVFGGVDESVSVTVKVSPESAWESRLALNAMIVVAVRRPQS